LAEWREIFEIPVSGRVERFRIERRPLDGGVEIHVTRLKDGATWSKPVSESEYRAWRYIDDYLKGVGAPPHRRVLAAIGVLGSGTATFIAGLFGWSRGYASRVLSELRRRRLIDKLPPRVITLVRPPPERRAPPPRAKVEEMTREEIERWLEEVARKRGLKGVEVRWKR